MAVVCLSALGVLAGGLLVMKPDTPAARTITTVSSLGAVDDGPPTSAEEVVNYAYEAIVETTLGLTDSDVVILDVEPHGDLPNWVQVPLDGTMHTLQLSIHSVRAPGYQLLIDTGHGVLVEGTPGPVRTMRGSVADVPGSAVSASMTEHGLHASIDLADGRRFWVEPVARLFPEAGLRHVIYTSGNVIPQAGTCGVPDAEIAVDLGAEMRDGGGIVGQPEGGAADGGLCIAELACDADFEYFSTYGSVTATENRINSVMNTVNLQYEAQVSITHQVGTIIVRSDPADPYTVTDAQDRLCQFITEWTNNQGSIQRDVAQLFTGVDLAGTTIGIAADIGATGICQNSGACTGGQFGTQGSYCLSQSDFNGNFSCATDLSAHELGHLWGAFHCSCSGNTMNSGITCANNFSAGTITSITNYRNTRTCLDGSCSGGPTPPDNDLCADATLIPCNTQEIVNTATATPVSGVSDPELPSGSPSCQWQGTPTNVHGTVWYEFVAADTSVEIQTCATTAIQDTIIALYDGSCGSLTELACSEDACGSSTYQSSICYDGLVPGATYTFVVGSPGGWASSTQGQIILDVTCPCPSVGPVAGACCLPGGACMDLDTPANCAANGGTFEGAGTTCAGANCGPSAEACCFNDDTCQDLDAADCAAQGGTPQGPGTDCTDTDGDGVADLCDGCPSDPNKTDPGVCGCGVSDADTDGDGVEDCNDGCPNDPNKTAPGACGCGVPDTDTDGDGTPNCNDGCPNDPNKTAPGDCGCGVADTDSDGDGTADCIDGCPNDPNKTAPGLCGCGVSDADSDGDGTPDCNDGCPNDPNKTAPGDCGCGVPDDDVNGNSIPDCNEAAACCVGSTCSLLTESACAIAGGVWQGLDTDCAGDPCAPSAVTNLAISSSTNFGTAVGPVANTHANDGDVQAITEEETNGNPNRRRSRLEHTWTFNVAPGSSYTFSVGAWHDDTDENDDMRFSYSLDNSAYTEMLIVTKNADDDGLQLYVFPENIAGTVYVRVEDTNRTQGNRDLDTVFVDEMFIMSNPGGDTTPPAAPTGLGATAGNGSVTLDWADNGEGDLAGYNVFRATTAGGPYSQVNGGPVMSSDYVDTGLANGTTYYYVVTAEDVSGNESGQSGEASATPAGSGIGMHVDSIAVKTVKTGSGGQRRGVATIVILDGNNDPVAGATVTGAFAIGIVEPGSGVTDSSGTVEIQTVGTANGNPTIEFCVTNVTHPILPYVPADNVETCDTN
jgi:hypothetical protein